MRPAGSVSKVGQRVVWVEEAEVIADACDFRLFDRFADLEHDAGSVAPNLTCSANIASFLVTQPELVGFRHIGTDADVRVRDVRDQAVVRDPASTCPAVDPHVAERIWFVSGDRAAFGSRVWCHDCALIGVHQLLVAQLW